MNNYFITVFGLKDPNDINSDYKRKRNWGYYSDKEKATKCVMENWTDIFEMNYYQIALIEECGQGPTACASKENRWWYDTIYDRSNNTYKVTETTEPIWAKGMVGYWNG